METILSAAFGRIMEVQRGESNDITEAAFFIFSSFKDKSDFNRQFTQALDSKYCSSICSINIFRPMYIMIIIAKYILFL